jgi:lysozyme family protein
MIANFAAALAAVRRWEGGLADHPSDHGGLTKWGISLRFLRAVGLDATGDGVVDGRDIRALSEDQVAQLYRTHFWMACLCDELPAGLDLAVFDCAVNQGPGRARRLLQASLGIKVDGILGPETLAAARAAAEDRGEEPGEKPGLEMTLNEFMARRALHYSSLSNLAVFGRGWFRRLFDIHARALGLM